MKKLIIKVVLVVVVFLATLFIVGGLINQGTTDMTMEMGEATFPVVSIRYNGIEINTMRGYAKEMQVSFMRESITPLMPGRKAECSINTYGTEISKIAYEVRSVDGSRLIEDTEIPEFAADGEGIITVNLELKDLIDLNQEYELILKLTTANDVPIYYYTRIVSQEDYHVSDKLEFVESFSAKTFQKEEAKELTKYLESNSEGDNTNFGKVNIHSSFDQITWGSLPIKRETRPQITIKEITPQTASISTRFYVSTQEEGKKTYYTVKEFYRVRYTAERIYLLDYERSMDQIFEEAKSSYVNNKIMLGIASDSIQMVESDDGNAFAFVTGNRLYSYNTVDNKMAYLFGYYDEKNADDRTLYGNHRIKILDVDEAGNVTFMVYGYMNRGRHEGEVGISTHYYDSTVNTVEEMIYIPSTLSPDLLIDRVEQLSYINRRGVLYLMDGDNIYGIQSSQRSVEIVAENLEEGDYKVSDSNLMIAWQKDASYKDCQTLVLMNLNTGKQKVIQVSQEETVIPIGFSGEDLIYGVAKKADIITDASGETILPMFCVKIENENEGVLMTYQQPNVYILSGTVQENQIVLKRVQKEEDGSYTEIADDQILNTESTNDGRITIEVAATQNYEKLAQIALKKDIDGNAMMHLTPKEVLFEGARTVVLQEKEHTSSKFYVYGKDGVEGVYDHAGKAVNLAESISGIVMNDAGNYVWQKMSRSAKNQIMAIQGSQVTEEKDALSICLDTMLAYEGVMRNSEYMLRSGETTYSILENSLENTQALDLTGCSLDAVLYYVNKDIPVLVRLEDGSAVLLIGFNEMNTVIMNPESGTVYKVGMNDSKEWFEQNGNRFVTYIRNEN